MKEIELLLHYSISHLQILLEYCSPIESDMPKKSVNIYYVYACPGYPYTFQYHPHACKTFIKQLVVHLLSDLLINQSVPMKVNYVFFHKYSLIESILIYLNQQHCYELLSKSDRARDESFVFNRTFRLMTSTSISNLAQNSLYLAARSSV